MSELNWTDLLAEQLDWLWVNHLRPRFDGLTDDEYFWEPVPGAWSIRPRTDAAQPGRGAFTADFSWPEPVPAPVTTIAWRLAHVTVGCLGARAASHFGGPPCAYETFEYAGDAATALKQLDDAYAAWMGGVRGLSPAALAEPIGPAEGEWAAHPMAGLVLHISKEVIHHGAEVALLRDLYLRKQR